MSGPQPVPLTLTDAERDGVELLIRRHTTAQQIAQHGRIVLLAAAGRNNAQIATELKLSLDAVRLWRQRWLSLQSIPTTELSVEERLADLPRPGAPARIAADQTCQIMAMACEPPSDSGRPISHWTNREIADEVLKRQIVDHISPRHAARLLKIGRP